MNDIVKAGLKYFLYFMLLYGTLTGLSMAPAVGSACNALYRKPTAPILQGLFGKAYIDLSEGKEGPQMIDVGFIGRKELARLRNQRASLGAKPGSFQVRAEIYKVKFYNMFLSFYLFFVALMLLSPVSWREKAFGLGIGTLVFYLFTVFKIALMLLAFFNQAEHAIYATPPWLLRIVHGLIYVLTLGVKVVFVLVLWAVLVFRKGNWKRLLGEV